MVAVEDVVAVEDAADAADAAAVATRRVANKRFRRLVHACFLFVSV